MREEKEIIKEIKTCIKEIEEVLLKHDCKIKPQNEGSIITKQGIILGFI